MKLPATRSPGSTRCWSCRRTKPTQADTDPRPERRAHADAVARNGGLRPAPRGPVSEASATRR